MQIQTNEARRMFSQHGQPAVASRRSLTRVAHFGAAVPADLIERLWNEPRALVEIGQPLRCKGVRRTVLLEWASQRYVLKHYVEPSTRHALKQLVQTSRAWRTWRVAHKLAEAGVATPRPIACIESRWGALRRDSFLMYPYVEGCTLRSCLADQAREHQSNAESLLRQLADLWQRLARVRASLADVNRGNFIVSTAGQLWVIDLDKACLHRWASVAARRQQRNWMQVTGRASMCNDDDALRAFASEGAPR